MSGKKVLCLGELLLRMSPKVNGEWIQENKMATFIGGAELNVASALAKWKIPTKYFTALPKHSLAQDLLNYLEKKSIDTSAINISGNRVGIYFLTQGSDLQNADVIYDRAYSSFSELQTGMINWDEALKDVSWLHFSAINPAINKNVTEVCKEALLSASKKGIKISLDLNYRSKLWKYGKAPVEVMPELAQYCDLIMGNIWAAEQLLGVSLKPTLAQDRSKAICVDHALYTSEEICKQFPKVKSVANTFRFDKDKSTIHYYATLYHNSKLHVSNEINASGIKDKIGSGDCFMGGLIYGFYNNLTPDEIVNFSSAAAVGKMYETSDATDQDVSSVLANVSKFGAVKI